MKRLLVLFFCLSICFAAPRPGKRPLWVVLKARPAVASVESLQKTADQTQAGLVSVLRKMNREVVPFWITNRVFIRDGDDQLADFLKTLSFVEAVEEETYFRIPDPLPGARRATVEGIPWNLAKIKANEAWGISRGKGAIIGIIDTGIADNPYTRDNFTGQFHDPSNICGGKVCDNQGHGTHVTGTAVGHKGDDYIGVAPDAKFVSCKGCESSSCSSYALLQCAQWMLTLPEQYRPHIISCSWGGPGGQTWFQDAARAFRTAGIFQAFAAGNDGPGCQTVSSPGDYVETYCVAATTAGDKAASFSSRGPGRINRQSPNGSAPGQDVCSVDNKGNIVCWSGTSMATPHFAGAAALMVPLGNLTPDDFDRIFCETAVPIYDLSCGSDTGSPNFTYGCGRLDALAAVRAVHPGPPPPPPPPKPTVTVAVDPNEIELGGSSTLTWSSENAETARLYISEQGNGSFVFSVSYPVDVSLPAEDGEEIPVEGSRKVSPQKTSRYKVVVKGEGGEANASAILKVIQPPSPPPPPPEELTVEILSPPNYSKITCGSVVEFTGRAIDPMEGDVTHKIRWWIHYPFWGDSPAFGQFSYGCNLGWHWVTAEVEKDGEIVKDTRMYQVVLEQQSNEEPRGSKGEEKK